MSLKPRVKTAILLITMLALVASVVLFSPLRVKIERVFVSILGADSQYIASGHSATLSARYRGADRARDKVKVKLTEVVRGLALPVDIQFIPHRPEVMLIAEKAGRVVWVNLKRSGERGVLLQETSTVSRVEQGLLGIALHPRFATNGRIIISATVALDDGREVSQISEWVMRPDAPMTEAKPRKTRVLLEVDQPYQNHNGGQVAFGPDGYLYIGLGDGGLANDPHGHGQNTQTLLGAMLRIDVDHEAQLDHASGARAYRVPADNPFVDDPRFASEIWAYGLRNPWRYSFAPDGRLIVADVGQNRLEEIAIVGAGQNHGWNIREGDLCFSPKRDCPTQGLTDPIYTYPHSEGTSVTGGYVYTGDAIEGLKGRYVFGDFTSGRMWALELPQRASSPVKPKRVSSLGAWPLLISSFGRDPQGELYVADFREGRVLKLTQ